MQQLFRLLIFLIQPYMFRATNSPILMSNFWLHIQLLVQCTGRQQCRCIVPKAVYAVKKCSWGWANLLPETCRTELKRLINEKFVASCWVFKSLYWNDAWSHKHQVWVVDRWVDRPVEVKRTFTIWGNVAPFLLSLAQYITVLFCLYSKMIQENRLSRTIGFLRTQ